MPVSIHRDGRRRRDPRRAPHRGPGRGRSERRGAPRRELERQRSQIELIASENFTWPSVLEAVGSVPTNKYAEGYPGGRYYGGCEVVDEIEQLAIDRAKALFGAEHANVQPHAGAQANMAVYLGLLDPGDTVLSLRLDHGGHLTHGLKVNFSGRLYTIVHYGVTRETSLVDEDEVLALAREHRPKVILCGGSAYPRVVDTKMFRAWPTRSGRCSGATWRTSPASSPPACTRTRCEDCDVVTSTTHKTLAGPRAGFILCREEHAQAIDRAIFPGLQGGPLLHAIAAKATCFHIAATEAFRAYQRQVRANADALAAELVSGGLDVLTGGTDTHLLQLDLRRTEWSGKDAEERLDEVRLTSTATPSRSTSDRRRSPRASASAHRRRRCAASTRTTSARWAASFTARSPTAPTSPRSRGAAGAVRAAPAVRAFAATRASVDGAVHGHRGRAPARAAQAGPAARRDDDDADVPSARRRADPAAHLRGDEGLATRRSRSRRRSSA